MRCVHAFRGRVGANMGRPGSWVLFGSFHLTLFSLDDTNRDPRASTAARPRGSPPLAGTSVSPFVPRFRTRKILVSRGPFEHKKHSHLTLCTFQGTALA